MSDATEKIIEPVTADVKAERIAHVYAEALFRAAHEQNQTKDVLNELTALVTEVFRGSPELEAFLSSDAAGRDNKKDVIQKTFEGRASETFANFLLVLNHHDRLDLLRPIQSAYKELFEEQSGQMAVEVRSATELSEQQLDRLRQQLRDSFQREPIVGVRIDPDLIGGFEVRVGDWVYDATVRTQLATLRNQLIERSSHAIQS